MKSPLISVLIPMYNAGDGIRITLKSIIHQTLDDYEVIVVDDGSEDNSAEIALNTLPDIHLFIQKNSGIALALNHGLQYCNGQFIARIDCNDMAYPESFKLQAERLGVDQELGAIGGHMMLFERDGTELGVCRFPITAEETEREMLLGNSPLPHSGAMIRKELLQQIGGYDPFYTGREDFEMWSRLSLLSKISNLNLPIIQVLSTTEGISFSSVNLAPLMELALLERNERLTKGLSWKNDRLRAEYSGRIKRLREREDSPAGRRRVRATFFGKRAGFLLKSNQRRAALKEYLNSLSSDITYLKAWIGIGSVLLLPNMLYLFLTRFLKNLHQSLKQPVKH
jgi:glycosyltransferase involved in cell wall biosynthesis